MLIISNYISLATTNTNREILIDSEDYELISKCLWHESSSGYAVSSVKPRIWMHKLIMGHEVSFLLVDHINRNKLDNRKRNLRHCTHSQNQMNKQVSKGKSSKYKGVCYKKDIKKWRGLIQKDRVRHLLGWFDTEEAAALAYNAKAKELYGEFAFFNVVE